MDEARREHAPNEHNDHDDHDDDQNDRESRRANQRDDGEQPIKSSPTLWRLNGCGLGFYGSRDHRNDGTYITTHCICLVFIPIIPIGAYRVANSDGGYYILTKAPLSGFAKKARLAVLALLAVVIAGNIIKGVLDDPDRLARKHVDDVLATVSAQPKASEASLQMLLALDEGELGRAGNERAEKVGAKVVTLTAALIARPFTRDSLEQAGRLVQRFQELPPIARGGAAERAAIETLAGFVQDLGTAADVSDVRLALLRHQEQLAYPRVPEALRARVTAELLVTVAAKEADWPLEAVELLMERPSPELAAHADPLIARLAKAPSILLDGSAALDAWVTESKDPGKAEVMELRGRAEEARKALEAEKLEGAALKAHLQKYPWDQYAVLQLAGEEASEGKLDAAAARLEAVGAPGLLVREARLLLGRIKSAEGKLEEADALLSSLIGARLLRYTAAEAQLRTAEQAAALGFQARLRRGDVPDDLRQKYEALTDEAAQGDLISNAISEAVRQDPQVISARDAYLTFADVVPASLAVGTVKLRRAQAMPEGEGRNAMLLEAERAFLAIRSAAEGQPEFRIGLGEIYARLGKTAESEAELAAVLAQDDPQVSLKVAELYRTIGNNERAKAVATQVFENAKANADQKSEAAVTLALLVHGIDDAESERWFRSADQKNIFVRISLSEIEARRLMRQGKRAACAAAYQEIATRYLAGASAIHSSGYNNAGLAQMQRFKCSGDLDALGDAEAAMEKAYRASRDNALVAGNYVSLLLRNAKLRVLGKRINLRSFPLDSSQTDDLFDALTDGSDPKGREEMLAALAANPAQRRGEQIFSEYEVLASSSTAPYYERLQLLRLWRDEAGLAALLERARKAKGLDLSQQAAMRQRWMSGARDAETIEESTAQAAELEAVAANGKLDAHTRGAALYLLASDLPRLAVLQGKPELAHRAVEAAGQAMQLWPAIDGNATIAFALIDEAGLAADVKAWQELRRKYNSVSALAKLRAESSPVATAILAAKPWSQVAAFSRADRARPGIDDLRLARLLGDASLEERARAVLDDKLLRLRLELDLLLDPTDPTTKEDLAYLDKR